MTPTSALQRDANLDTTQPGVTQPVAAAAARLVSVFALYGLCSLVLLQTQLFGDRSFIACCDASIQSYAWLGKVAEAARTLTIPMCDFSTYAGISFVGELQQGPLYPPSWILGILGFSKMPLVDAFLVLHFVLAAGFMHLLLRSFRPRSISGYCWQSDICVLRLRSPASGCPAQHFCGSCLGSTCALFLPPCNSC
jgi:hypothetical protein